MADQIVVDAQGRPEPPAAADEAATILGFLEFQRATFAWRTGGLDADGLSTRVAASSMTLGGMLKHLAYVEGFWFSRCLLGLEPAPELPKDTPEWHMVEEYARHNGHADLIRESVDGQTGE